MNEIELLISSCNISLTLLIDQYKKGKISFETLEKNSNLKIIFLGEHLEKIQSIKEKALSKQILLEYKQITEKNPRCSKDNKSQA